MSKEVIVRLEEDERKNKRSIVSSAQARKKKTFIRKAVEKDTWLYDKNFK